MITFKQFLKEEEGITLEQILSECQPYIQQSKGDLIYRGSTSSLQGRFKLIMPDGEKYAYRMDVRKDRRPTDTEIDTHNRIDKWMKQKFGIAGRSQTLFVTGSPEAARDYGYVYIVIPRGDIRFLWSPNTEDMYAVEFEDIEDLEYQTTDLPRAIMSKHEIMMECDDYYMIEDSPDVRTAIQRAFHEMRKA